MEYITQSARETQELGKKISSSLISESGKPVILALVGNLGSGKTTFVQGFATGLGLEQRIISPTFILMRKYEAKSANFYHIDLYRLEKNIESEARNLGLMDIWKRPENVVVIEWAEKIKSLLPESVHWVQFENTGENTRKIRLSKRV